MDSDKGDRESLHSGPTPLGRGASEAAATDHTTKLSRVTAPIVLILTSSLKNSIPMPWAVKLETEQVGNSLSIPDEA